MRVKPGLSGDSPIENPPIGGPLVGLPGSPNKTKVLRLTDRRRGGDIGPCGEIEGCDELNALGLVGMDAVSVAANGSDNWSLERNTGSGDGDETTLR